MLPLGSDEAAAGNCLRRMVEMIIEQAFHNLPEVLVGSGYAKQKYEAGIVTAFSLAILQELNGRNIADPIGCLCAEMQYPDIPKKLRADLHVQLDRLHSGSRDYSEFGFRHSNWVEAKFFRGGGESKPSTQNIVTVIADLLRLVVLVPIQTAKRQKELTITGRYYLHAYYGPPLEHLNPKRKRKGAAQRAWIGKLLESGERTIDGFELDQEPDKSFDDLRNGLGSATCRIGLTNFVLQPTQSRNTNYYTIVLSRIDSAEFSMNGESIVLKTDRTFERPSKEKLKDLRAGVALAVKPKTVSKKKEQADEEEDVDDQSADTTGA